MQKNMDKIQMESRREIENIMIVLQQWQQDHKNDPYIEHIRADAELLYCHLESMHISW